MFSKFSKSWKILYFILLYLTTDLAQDLNIESAQDLNTESAQDLTTESAKDLTAESAQEVPKESTQVLTTASAKDLRTESAKDITTESAKDITTESAQEVSKESTQELTTESTQDITTEVSFTELSSEEICHELIHAYIAISHDPLYDHYNKIDNINDDRKINVCGFAIFFDALIDRFTKNCSNESKLRKLQNDEEENCKDVVVDESVQPCLYFAYEYYKSCDEKYGHFTIVEIDRNFFYSKRALCCNKNEYIQCRMNQVNLICQNTTYMRNYAEHLSDTYEKIKNSVCKSEKCSVRKPKKFSKDQTQSEASVITPCISIFMFLFSSEFMRLNHLIFFRW